MTNAKPRLIKKHARIYLACTGKSLLFPQCCPAWDLSLLSVHTDDHLDEKLPEKRQFRQTRGHFPQRYFALVDSRVGDALLDSPEALDRHLIDVGDRIAAIRLFAKAERDPVLSVRQIADQLLVCVDQRLLGEKAWTQGMPIASDKWAP